MADPKTMMEVPAQVREFAANSVEQAEKAVSSLIDAANKSVAMMPGPMGDIAKQTLSITERNTKAAFEHTRKLMHAKDIQELMQLQTDFLKSQFANATEQMKQMAGGVAAAASKVKPDLI